MVDVHPMLRLVLQLSVPAVVAGWLLVGGVARWWTRSLTIVVARARLSGWCACLGRLFSHVPPAANSPELGARVLPTVGSVSPTADPTVAHPRRAA